MALLLRLGLILSAIGSGVGGSAGGSKNIVQENGSLILQEDGVSTILTEN